MRYLHSRQIADPFLFKLNIFLFANEKRRSQAFHQILNGYMKPLVSFPIDPALIGTDLGV